MHKTAILNIGFLLPSRHHDAELLMPHYRLSELEIHHNNHFVQGHVIQTVVKRFYGSFKKHPI